MDERTIQFRVGVVVVAALAITVILIFMFGTGRKLFTEEYTIYVGFPRAPGVTVDTPVRKSGVLIGRVSEVKLLDEGGVILTLRIDKKYRLRQNETARISPGSLVTGDAVVEFVPAPQRSPSDRSAAPIDPTTGLAPPGTDGELQVTLIQAQQVEPADEFLQDEDYVANGVVAGDPLDVLVNLEEDMADAIFSIQMAGQDVSAMARGLSGLIVGNEAQITRIMQKSEQTLDQLQTTLAGLEQTLGDPQLQANLRRTLEGLPELFDETRRTMDLAQTTLESFQRVSQRAERNLENLEGLTGPLGERGEQLALNVENSLANLNRLLEQLADLSEAVNQRDGTLGQLVYDDDLYNKLARAAENVEEATRRMQPILDDVRVFTDKIATDPRQLGVKGALDRRPLGVGLQHDLSVLK